MAGEDFSEFLKKARESSTFVVAPPTASRTPITQETPEVVPQPAPEAAPTVDFSDYLSRAKSGRGFAVPPARAPLAATEPVTDKVDYSKLNYSQDDLTKDEFFKPIQEYMIDRYGPHMKDENKEDLVDMFMNNMRGFAGGNSVRALSEITYLNSVGKDEKRLGKAGAAYTIFENMQGLTGDTSGWERFEIVKDYARSAVLDPINVLSLGTAKTATSVGFKAGSQLALITAKRTFQKTLAEEVGKGVVETIAKKTAQEAAETVFKTARAELAAKTTAKIAQRQAIEKAATTNLQRMTTSTALKEAAVTGTFEAAVSAGTDYLYQDALLRTKVQDEYNLYQTGLSAVIGLVAGGLSGMLGNVGAGKSKLVAPEALKTSPKGNTSIGKLFTETAVSGATPPEKGALKMGDWMRDVAKGRELKDQDTEFFLTMVLGNEEKGLKGLAQILLEDGYVWERRSADDKVSNWIGDIIKEADPQDAKKFIDEFTKATGIDMVEGKTLTVEAFADTFKKKMSDSGRLLNSVSQMAKILGRDAETFTGEDYLRFVLGGGVDDITNRTDLLSTKIVNSGKSLGKTVDNIINRDLPDFQNNTIRLMVANLSTTGLNVTGFAANSGLNSAADITKAIVTGGWAGILMATDPVAAKKLGLSAKGIIANQIQKARNILDTNTTYETYLKYVEARPQAMRQLSEAMSGGIDSIQKLSKELDLSKPLFTMRAEQAVDFISRVNHVNSQDAYTKSIEFVSQLDGLLRRSTEEGGFGKSWNEFFSDPTHHKQMISDRYVRLEATAIDRTLKATMSKSYKGKDALGELAGMVEDARKLPFVGMLMPFGRFFNNTVATTLNVTGIVPLAAKVMGRNTTDTYGDILAKTAVTWSIIGAMSEKEIGYISKGLGWSEEIDESTGEVIDERYEFPYGLYKAAARLVAHYRTGTERPGELTTQIFEQFAGQLTRQLEEAGGGILGIFKALLSDEGPSLMETLGNTAGTIAAQFASGMTRPLEPLNAIVGLTRDEEFYTPDRKQGTKWANNSMRYIDQFVALATGENIAPPKYSAAEGQPVIPVTKLVSTTRPSRLTNIERVMNSIGLPPFKADEVSLSEPADNRVNQLFNQLVESQAGILFDSKAFQKGNLEVKQALWADLLSNGKETVKQYMGSIASSASDNTMLRLLEVSGYGKEKVRRTMEDLGFDRPLDELSDEELVLLQSALKFRKEYLMNKP